MWRDDLFSTTAPIGGVSICDADGSVIAEVYDPNNVPLIRAAPVLRDELRLALAYFKAIGGAAAMIPSIEKVLSTL